MTVQHKKLLKEVLDLPLKDRRSLVRKVLANMDDEEFRDELRRRRDEVLSGADCMVPWTEILKLRSKKNAKN